MEASGHRHPGAPQRSEAPSRRAAVVACTGSERGEEGEARRAATGCRAPADRQADRDRLPARPPGAGGMPHGNGCPAAPSGQGPVLRCTLPTPPGGERRSACPGRARVRCCQRAASVAAVVLPARSRRMPADRAAAAADALAAAGMHFALIFVRLADARACAYARVAPATKRAPRTFNARQTCHLRPACFPCDCQLSVRCRTGRGFYAYAND
jgi:hypothetical protein